MSWTLIKIVALAIVLSGCFILRWKRHIVLRWTVRWICPREIFFLEFVEERNHICARGYVAFLRRTSTWKTFFCFTIGITVLSLSLAGLTIAYTRAGQWGSAGVKAAAILCLVIPLNLIPLMCLQYRKWMRAFLREYLNDHGMPICRNCGYDLRGQVHPRCPECGTAFVGKDPADDLSMGRADQSSNRLGQS